MAERLSMSKLIRDLSGRPPEPFFGETWERANAADIERARRLHAEANFNEPAIISQADQQRNQLLERELGITEDEDEDFGDDRESYEELPGRGPK